MHPITDFVGGLQALTLSLDGFTFLTGLTFCLLWLSSCVGSRNSLFATWASLQ